MKKILFLSLCVLFIAGCGTEGSRSAKENTVNMRYDTNAHTYGVDTDDFNNDISALGSIRIRAPHNQVYYFNFDSDNIQKKDLNSVAVQSSYLIANPNVKVRLEGNTDERGSREYNIGLGWRRAKAVGQMLEQQGVSPKRIVMVSYGEEKPAVFGHDETAYAKNRRVNLIYKAK